MRGLAIATLFLGMALIDPGANVDARACMALVRVKVKSTHKYFMQRILMPADI